MLTLPLTTGQNILSAKLQLWEFSDSRRPTHITTVDFMDAFTAVFGDRGLPTVFTPNQPQRMDEERSPDVCVLLPSHLSIEKRGVVTIDRHRKIARLWELVGGSWTLCSAINLPLQMLLDENFDGNRFVAIGRDHIGPIILIYQVLANGSPLIADLNAEAQFQHGLFTEASGGVFNLSAKPHNQFRFANRIRHPKMIGADSLKISCNERFLVVQIKSNTDECGILSFDFDG